MNKQEKELFEQLQQTINSLRKENKEFKDAINEQVQQMENKVVNSVRPFELQDGILKVLQTSMNDVIKNVLGGYNSPLTALVHQVVNDHSTELREIISESFGTVIKTDNFKESIVSAFSHKVSRTIISNNDGLFDKVSNDLKQDNVFKSKMTLAVATVIEEILKERKEN